MKSRAVFFRSVIGTALLFAGVHLALATTRTVTNLNDSGSGSLRDTIAASAPGDTIVFSVTGTITLTSDQLSVNHNLTILGPGAPWQLIITRSPNTQNIRIFYFDNGTWSLSNVTVNNGYSIQGGGIYNGNGNLTLSNCVVSGNTASFDGGGIYNKATTSAVNCTITGNRAFSYSTNDPRLDGGGGIYNSGTFTLTNSTVDTNVDNYLGENGGGIYNAGNFTIKSCTFYKNVVNGNSTTYHSLGGAIFNHSGTLTVRNCTFSENSASGSAGSCIYNSQNASASVGGCIFAFHPVCGQCGPFNLAADAGTSISSAGYNLSTDDGGGFLNATHDQINKDPKLDPNGIRYNGGYTDTIAIVVGSPAIDAGNSFGTNADQTGRARPTDNPNIANASDGSDIGAYESPADPLQSGSPSYVVTTVDDHDDGICGAADCTLREAIARINSLGVGRIQFSHVGTITLQTAPFVLDITSTIEIDGPGARALAISGNGTHRVLNVDSGTSTISGLTIRDGNNVTTQNHGETRQAGGVFNSANVTFTDCEFINNVVSGATNINSGGNGGAGQGGAFFNVGTLTLNNCTFIGNAASGAQGAAFSTGGTIGPGGNGGAAQGGAVFNNTTATLAITNCTFSGNTATGGAGGTGNSNSFLSGGGNANGGAIFNLGNMTVIAATISGNTGNGGAGERAGIRHGAHGSGNGGVSAGGGLSTLESSIVAGNSGNTAPDAEGTFNGGGYNLIGIGDQSTGFSANNFDQIGTAASPLNPHLGALQNNGGATDTMVLLHGSPALDLGYNFGLTNDQRGSPRTVSTLSLNNAYDGTDIGAVEMNLLGGTDSDGDGMSDDFEIFYGFNPLDPSDANLDSDHDGMTNLQEFLAGTNPLDANSVFRVTDVAKNANDLTVVFGIALTAKTYRLERKDAITDTSWNSITGVADFTPAYNGAAAITDPGGASTTKHFYRVRVLP